MDRGLIVGALGFAAGFAAERLFTSLSEDLARYDALRKMSGQSPFFKEFLGLLGLAGGFTGGEAGGAFAGLAGDIVRYAKLKGM